MHPLVQILNGHTQVLGLYQHHLVGALLHSFFLIIRYIGHLGLVPFIVGGIYAFKEFGYLGSLDVTYAVFARHHRFNLFQKTFFCFGKAQCIHQIGLSHFLQQTCFHCLIIPYFAFKPFLCHNLFLSSLFILYI